MRAGTMTRRSPAVAWASTLVLSAVLVLGSSCTATAERAGTPVGTGSGSVPGTDAPGTTRRPHAPPAPEQYEGPLDEFYRVPDPLPPGEPGDLIRVQAVKQDDSTTTLRVMYHSRDVRDRDRAVTGVITYPNRPAPDGGWPVVAWAHGTTGLSSGCAPSRRSGAAPAFGSEGVAVATDYIGLGPIGERHPYLSGPSEAHSVIDSVRAARLLPDAHAGTTWVAVGHSQGGHSALWTNELGAQYAPELDLRGTAAIAPAAVLDRTFGPADQIVPRMVGVMALYGMAADHPEIVPEDYVGDEVRARAGVIDEGCLDQVVAALVGIPAEGFYKADPLDTEPARSVWRKNDPGHVRVDAPLLVVMGTADVTVVPERVRFLNDQLCRIDQVTELVVVDGANHNDVVTQGGPQLTRWLEGRLAGAPAPDTCGAASG